MSYNLDDPRCGHMTPVRAFVKPVEFHRLSSESYKAFESKLNGPVVTEETTALQAGYRLGIQHALKMLREGYVVGE